jgi:hypothetical protein
MPILRRHRDLLPRAVAVLSGRCRRDFIETDNGGPRRRRTPTAGAAVPRATWAEEAQITTIVDLRQGQAAEQLGAT